MTEPALHVAIVDELAAEADAELAARLGVAGTARLRELLLGCAREWGRRAGRGAEPLHFDRAAGAAAALGRRPGPVALLAPDVPGVGPGHLAGALDDLAAGVELTAAAAADAQPFLIVLREPDEELLRIALLPFNEMFAAAHARGGAVGMLRHERRLASLGDARAVVADPLAPAGLRSLLRPVVV